MENTLSIVKDKFKELPNNIEAEQAVIGSILVTNEIFDEINTIISSSNFYDPMHQKIFAAIESLIYKGMLANPITLKNYFEDEKDDINVPEYLVKVTKFSTSVRQAVEYSKIIYDMFVRRELIKISEETIDSAKLNDLDTKFRRLDRKNYTNTIRSIYRNDTFTDFHMPRPYGENKVLINLVVNHFLSKSFNFFHKYLLLMYLLGLRISKATKKIIFKYKS